MVQCHCSPLVLVEHDGYAPSTRAAAESASPSFSGWLPPAWASSGLPPPLPPTIGASCLIISPALNYCTQLFADRDQQVGLAVDFSAQNDHPGTHTVPEGVGKVTQPLDVLDLHLNSQQLNAVNLDTCESRSPEAAGIELVPAASRSPAASPADGPAVFSSFSSGLSPLGLEQCSHRPLLVFHLPDKGRAPRCRSGPRYGAPRRRSPPPRRS